jgi:hypothetical protein
MGMSSTDLEKRVKDIENRNQKVTADKAWEVSKTRRAIIFVATYLIIALYSVWINANQPWLTALVPPVAFLLSTLALQKIKNLWIAKRLK